MFKVKTIEVVGKTSGIGIYCDHILGNPRLFIKLEEYAMHMRITSYPPEKKPLSQVVHISLQGSESPPGLCFNSSQKKEAKARNIQGE